MDCFAGARSLGWSGDLLLFRSCDGEVGSARRLYHSGETMDVDLVVRHLAASAPDTPLVSAASHSRKRPAQWLGEQGNDATRLVRRAAAVSVPFDLAAGSRYLERGFSRFYTKHFLATLLPKAERKLEQFPGAFDAAAARRAKTFWEFDSAVTAPLHGFRDAADYYERSSSMPFIARVRVPTLVFSALDDPFVPPEVMEEAARRCSLNSSMLVELTAAWWACRMDRRIRVAISLLHGGSRYRFSGSVMAC